MLKYLIIPLCETSTSYCHYDLNKNEPKLIDLRALKKALIWSMKENLIVHFIYPDYELPDDYKNLIETIDHADIVSCKCCDIELKNNAEVVVFDGIDSLKGFIFNEWQAYVVRTALSEFLEKWESIAETFSKSFRFNVVITDVHNFGKDPDNESKYEKALDRLAKEVKAQYLGEHSIQFNLLTDRLLLDKMNNCNAGEETIALMPDGKFYVCPAFYYENSDRYSVGDIESGLNIKNPQLYRLDYAPICRICDAWQCKRCVWLNKKMTLEVNTPSHEQCVIAHIERNASRKLLEDIRERRVFMPYIEIPKLDYLDPFDMIVKL